MNLRDIARRDGFETIGVLSGRYGISRARIVHAIQSGRLRGKRLGGAPMFCAESDFTAWVREVTDPIRRFKNRTTLYQLDTVSGTRDIFLSRRAQRRFESLHGDGALQNILEFILDGKSYTAIAKIFGLTKQRVQQIARRHVPDYRRYRRSKRYFFRQNRDLHSKILSTT